MSVREISPVRSLRRKRSLWEISLWGSRRGEMPLGSPPGKEIPPGKHPFGGPVEEKCLWGPLRGKRSLWENIPLGVPSRRNASGVPSGERDPSGKTSLWGSRQGE